MPRDPIDEGDVIVLTLDAPMVQVPSLEVPAIRLMESASLREPPSPTFAGRGARSLVDKVRGSSDANDGKWLGFEKSDCEAVIDLNAPRNVSGVVVGSLQAQGTWIFLPRGIEVSVSEDGREYMSVGSLNLGDPTNDATALTKDLTISFSPVSARFVKVRVTNVVGLPFVAQRRRRESMGVCG